MALIYNNSNPAGKGEGTLAYVSSEIDPNTGLDLNEGNRKTAPLYYSGVPQSSVDRRVGATPLSYSRILGDNYHPEFSQHTIQQQLAANQSGAAQFLGFLNQAVVGEIAGGILEGIGYLADLRGPVMFNDENDNSFGRLLVDTGKAMRTWAEDTTPIYQDPDAPDFDPTSWSWWMKNGTSVASTLSLMIPAAGAVRGVGAVGKLLGLAGKLGVGLETGLSVLGQATISRRMEGMMEARGSYEEVFNDAISKGMSKEDATKKASIAASKTYSKDWAMLGMDIAQYALLHGKLFKPNAAGVTPAMGKLLGYDAAKVVLPEVKRYGLQMTGEAFEEGYQWVAAEEAKWAAEKAFDPTLKGDFSDRAASYLRNGEMWTNAFFGAIGGGVMTGVADATKMFTGDPQVNEVKSWGVDFKALYEKIKTAESLGDEHMKSEARSQLAYSLGVRGASQGMLDATVDMYDKVANGSLTTEDIQKLGYDPESIQDLKGTDVEKTKAEIRNAGMKYLETLKEVYRGGSDLNKSLQKLYAKRPKDMANISLENYGRSYASLLTRTELGLNKLGEIQSLVEREARDAEDRIANISLLSANGRQQLLSEARLSSLKKHREYMLKNIKGKNIDENYKTQLEGTVKLIENLINLRETEIKRLKDSYTKEDAEKDKPINLESPAVEEHYRLVDKLASITASIDSYQRSLERYRKGEISSEEATTEYDNNLDEENNDDVTEFTPEESDIVSWINQEDGTEHFGVIEMSDETDSDVFHVQEIDENYKDIGKPLPKNKVDLQLVNKIRDLELDKIEIETESSDDLTADDLYREELANTGINKSLADFPNSLSTSNIDASKPSRIDVRDVRLDAYSSDPNNKFEGAVATYSIDWNNKFWDEGGKERRQFKLKALAGELTLEEVQKLLTIDPANAANFGVELVDKLPIKVSIKVGEQTFDKALYVHDSDFWNVNPENELQQRQDNRSIRYNIITSILNGETVTTENITKLNGWFNVVKTHGNVHQRLGVESGSLIGWIGVPSPAGNVQIQASSTDIRFFGNPKRPGGVYITTKKTASGSEALLRVNPAKLSTEHAEILWDAIMLLYAKNGGRKAKLKDERVKGLTAQEVIDLLVLYGPRSTNPAHPNNVGKDLQQSKALYSIRTDKGRMLFFGDKQVPVYENNPALYEDNKLKFIEWATQNKNYRVPLGNKKLALELNQPFKKKFTLGSFVNDGSKSYFATMLDTVIGTDKDGVKYMISTNVDRVKDPSTGEYIESITHSPIIDINTRSLIVTAPAKPAEPVVEKKPEAELPQPITERKQRVSIANLKQLPVDTNFYYTSVDGKKVIFAVMKVARGVRYVDLVNGFQNDTKLHNFRSLRVVKSNQENFDFLFNYMMAGSTEINYELPISKAEKEDLVKVEQNKQQTLSTGFDNNKNNIVGRTFPFNVGENEKGEPYNHRVRIEKVELLPDGNYHILAVNKINGRSYDMVTDPNGSVLSYTRDGKTFNNDINDEIVFGADVFVNPKEEPKPPQTPPEDYDTGDESLDDLRPIGAGKSFYHRKPGQKVLSKQDEEWLYKKFGKQNLVKTKKLIQLAGQKGRWYFGLFRADAITIYEAAPADVLYHEAFHRVSLGYLSEFDRKRVYDAARKRYELLGASDSEIEERLADEFMDYKSNGGKPYTRTAFEFIQDLYDFIVTFFTGKTRLRGDDIDRLFASIERGQYRFSEISDANLKALEGRSVGYEIGGKDVPTINNVKEMDDFVKGLATVLIVTNHIDDLNDINKLDFGKLVKYVNYVPNPDLPKDDPNNQPGILQRFRSIKKRKELLLSSEKDQIKQMDLENDIDEVRHLISLYESLLNPDYFPIFVARIEAALMSYNIVRKEQEDVEYVENANQYKASYEFNTKDNVLASVKFLIATLPASDKVNRMTFTLDHVDFNEVWSRLLFDLWDKDSIDEILDELKSKDDYYPYKKLYEKLKAGDDILRIQFKVAMNKHKHSFINFVFNTKQPIEQDAQTGQLTAGRDTFNFKISNSDIFSASKREIMNWNQLLYETNIIDKTEKVPKINVNEIKKVQAELELLGREFSDVFTKSSNTLTGEQYDKYVTALVPIFAKIGIEVDRPTIAKVIEKRAKGFKVTKEQALNEYILKGSKYILDRLVKEASNKTKPLGRLFSDENTVRALAETKYEVHPDLMNDSILGAGGNQFFTYSQNTYLSDMIRKFSKDKVAVMSKLQKIYNKRSDFLAQMLDDEVRSGVKILSHSAFIQEDVGDSGRDYLGINRLEDYLMKLYAFEKGIIPLPTLADKKSYFYIQGLKALDFNLDFDENGNIIIPENVINTFMGYAEDERERISKVQATIKDYADEKDPVIKEQKKANLISNYHGIRRGENIDTNKANGLLYHLFPSFNREGFDFNKDAKEEIKNILLARINEQLIAAEKRGVITGVYLEDGKFRPDFNLKIDSDLIETNKKDYGTETKALQNVIARYTIRTMQSCIEFGKLFVGDPSFKSMSKDKGTVWDDYVKRLSGGLSTGDVTNNESIEYGVIGNTYNVSTMYTQTFNLEKMFPKNVYNDIFDAHLAEAVKDFSKVTKKNEKGEVIKDYSDLPNKSRQDQIDILKDDFGYNIKEMLKAYTEIDPTDGQAWISPDMFRSLCINVGDWSPKKEEAFKLLQSDKDLSKEEYLLSLNIVMQPLKVVSFGLMEDGDIEVPVFDKMAMATIFRQMGKFGHGKDKRIELMELLDRMEAKGKYDGMTPVDMVRVVKVAKTGVKGGFNFYSDPELKTVSDFSNIPIVQQPFGLSRRQLVTDPHDQSRTKAGTQFVKIGMADILLQEQIYTDPILGKDKITGQDIVDIIVKSTGELSNKGLDRLKSRLGFKAGSMDKKKLVDMLKKNNIKSGTADLIVDAFKMDSDGQMYLELDAFPNRKYIFSTIVSLFAKEVIDLRLPGNQFIQVSNLGARVNSSDELKWTTISNTRVKEMECYVSINLFKHVIPNYDKITFEEKREFILRNADSIMGYRIPTEGQKSVFIMKIKDVYPETIGDVITLPAAFTSLTGSDFDIDKVYVIRHNYKIIDNYLHKVEFHNTLEEVWDKELKIKYFWIYRYLDELDNYTNKKSLNDKDKDRIRTVLDNLTKTIDDEIMDSELKESILSSIKANLDLGIFDAASYSFLKQGVGDSIEDNKQKFLDKYKDETDPYRFNSRAAVENLLIDAYKSVYTNLAHVRQTTTPLGGSVKVLKDLATEIHKFDDSESLTGDLSQFTPSAQSDIKSEYNTGKEGIGPFALNNVHHVLAQIAGLKMRMSSMGLLNEDANGNIDLSQINGKDGISIMTWLESLIEIHVDVAKDPFVAWLNLNATTYDITALLIRGGLGVDTFRFISQPILKEFSSLMLDSMSDNRIKRFKDRDEVINYIKEKWNNKLKAATEANKDSEVTTLTQKQLFETKELMSNITNQKQLANNPQFISKQLEYFNLFINLSKAGKLVNELVQASQLDTQKFGNSMTSVIMFKRRIDKILKDNNFQGLDKMFGPGSFLGAYYTNFLEFTLDSMSEFSIASTPVFNRLLLDILRQTKAEFSGDKKLIDNISDELIGAIFAKFFNDEDFVGMNPEKLVTVGNRQGIIDYVTSIITDIKYKKDPKYTKLFEENSLIKMLDKYPIEDMEAILPFETFLAIPNKSLSDKFSTDSLIYAWRDLFDHPDKKIQNLARLLIYYSYITSGFRNRLFSFHNYIPPSKMKNLDVVDPKNPDGPMIPLSFNEFIKAQRDLLSDDMNYAMFAHLVDEVIINNWSNSGIVPRAGFYDRVKGGITYFNGKEDQDTPTAVIVKKYNNQIGKNKLGQPIYTKYLTTSIRKGQQNIIYLLKYIGFTTVEIKGKTYTNAVYKVVSKRSYEKGGVVFKEFLFDKSVIPTNNVVSIPDGQELSVLRSKEQLAKNKLFDNFEPVEDTELGIKEEIKQRNIMTGEFVEGDMGTIESDIYNQLGNRTESGHVRIESWGSLKDATEPVIKQGDSIVSVIATRVKQSDKHFGNPFSHEDWAESHGLIKTKTIKEAVEKYIDWVINSSDERAVWIRSMLKTGELKNKRILYWKELNEPSHATALDYLINKYDWTTKPDKHEWYWSRFSTNGYEVSTKGDKRFSALVAKLSDGRTIEEHYQVDIKGYNSITEGKGKPPLKSITREEQWLAYKGLWKQYLNENPGLLEDLAQKAEGKPLTDMFASSNVSQARALAEILNETEISLIEEYPFLPDDEKTIFSTANKEVYDLVVKLNITDWASVSKSDWAQLRDKYKHCK